MDYVLNMPAATFFLMIKQGRRRHAYQLAELCDVQAISICHTSYHEQLKGRYMALADSRSVPSDTPTTKAIDAGSTDARDFFFTMVRSQKGIRH